MNNETTENTIILENSKVLLEKNFIYTTCDQTGEDGFKPIGQDSINQDSINDNFFSSMDSKSITHDFLEHIDNNTVTGSIDNEIIALSVLDMLRSENIQRNLENLYDEVFNGHTNKLTIIEKKEYNKDFEDDYQYYYISDHLEIIRKLKKEINDTYNYEYWIKQNGFSEDEIKENYNLSAYNQMNRDFLKSVFNGLKIGNYLFNDMYYLTFTDTHYLFTQCQKAIKEAIEEIELIDLGLVLEQSIMNLKLTNKEIIVNISYCDFEYNEENNDNEEIEQNIIVKLEVN